MNVRFTLEALTHIATIRSYIKARSPAAAGHVIARIFAEAERLEEFPHLGHVGVVPGTYELTVRGLPYLVVHEVHDDKGEVIVIGVFHAAQQR